MKQPLTLLVLLGAAWGGSPARALAQCHFAYVPVYAHHTCHCRHDSCEVKKPFVPARWGGYLGALGMVDQQRTPYAGVDAMGYYWLRPRWATGLRGNLTGKMPVGAAPETVGAQQPLVDQYAITWTNNLLLLDQPRWRVMAVAGAGVGGARLYDKAVQVATKGNCGCGTTAKEVAGAAAPVTEVGLAALYKLKGPDAPWLTLRGEYRQWNGSAPFGLPQQFSSYVLSIGVSLPDAPPKGR
ncbi:hypothetical protein Q5H92_21620 [Hymenobacter sp. M29]|uniref:Outer membrane protein beta-barrel domain-containing protein n=1 Tax=Hymenobacter mellowenesis TaxID=3063995 RepID=A0ABT9AGH9_9BACT|nr:hypothetical protein [Hymenobacter sp. M29]MDO7848978.1 hypothetical protein [Hymenobacter sp. M29]